MSLYLFLLRFLNRIFPDQRLTLLASALLVVLLILPLLVPLVPLLPIVPLPIVTLVLLRVAVLVILLARDSKCSRVGFHSEIARLG